MKILGLDLRLPGASKSRRHDPYGEMSYSQSVAPLERRHTIGFVMVSTLADDKERGGLFKGAIPSKNAFMKAMQSRDLLFVEVSPDTGAYLAAREAYASHRAVAERELAKFDYTLLLVATHGNLPGTPNISEDVLRPRLYNNHAQLVKRLEECYWSDQTVATELQVYVEALARATRMEMRAVIRRQEALRN